MFFFTATMEWFASPKICIEVLSMLLTMYIVYKARGGEIYGTNVQNSGCPSTTAFSHEKFTDQMRGDFSGSSRVGKSSKDILFGFIHFQNS